MSAHKNNSERSQQIFRGLTIGNASPRTKNLHQQTTSSVPTLHCNVLNNLSTVCQYGSVSLLPQKCNTVNTGRIKTNEAVGQILLDGLTIYILSINYFFIKRPAYNCNLYHHSAPTAFLIFISDADNVRYLTASSACLRNILRISGSSPTPASTTLTL